MDIYVTVIKVNDASRVVFRFYRDIKEANIF